MYRKKDINNDDQNFWISYADLMAGLLFVFILLVGAIVIKYVFIQTDLQAIKTDLEKEKAALNISDAKLEQKKKDLDLINQKLTKSKEQNLHLSFELAKAKNIYEQTKKELDESLILNKELNEKLNNKSNKLKLSNEQIEKITKILKDKENNIVLLEEQMEVSKKEIAKYIADIALNKQELSKLKQLLLDYELKQKDLNSTIQTANDKISQQKNMLSLKDEELAILEKKLITQSKEHQKLVEEFDITKVKIKNLTGVRIKVITALKSKLGDSIDIDPKSGNMRFSSNILFQRGQYSLKEESKKELSSILRRYIHTLLLDENIRKHIESITIEGYTDSDGNYMMNLELSQKRALEVMKFLYSLDFKDYKLLEKYISASGRSYSNLVYTNGKENKEASRRIEIKFHIKNEKAIKEIENYLSKNRQKNGK